MALLSRDTVKPAALPQETHPCVSLGGEVIVRGALLTDRLKVENSARDGKVPVEELIPRLLALAVVDASGQPLMDESDWNQHAGQHRDDCLQLFNVAMRLWGYDGEANRKNS